MGEYINQQPASEAMEELRRKATQIFARNFDYLSLMSDYYFTAFMQENVSCMQLMLRAFMRLEDIEVTEVRVQHVVKNGKKGHGVRYDAFVLTKNHGVYDVEIENRPKGSLALRLRYYAAMMDKENLEKNEDYADLPPLTVIVVTPKDMGGKGEPLTFVCRVYMESADKIGAYPRRFEDKEMFVFVNSKYRDTSTLVGKVIHDLTTINSQPKITEEFATAVEKYVSLKEGRLHMSQKFVEYGLRAEDLENLVSDAEIAAARAEARAEGKAEGKVEGKAEGISQGISQGISRGISRGQQSLAEFLLNNGYMSKAALEDALQKMGSPLSV